MQAANINATFAKRQADAEALAAAEKAAALRRQRGQTAAAQAQQALQQRLDMLRLASQAYDLAQALHKVQCKPCWGLLSSSRLHCSYLGSRHCRSGRRVAGIMFACHRRFL